MDVNILDVHTQVLQRSVRLDPPEPDKVPPTRSGPYPRIKQNLLDLLYDYLIFKELPLYMSMGCGLSAPGPVGTPIVETASCNTAPTHQPLRGYPTSLIMMDQSYRFPGLWAPFFKSSVLNSNSNACSAIIFFRRAFSCSSDRRSGSTL